MKILIDTGHPAHLYYFYPVAKQLEKNGHSVLFTIREKDCSVLVADSLSLGYVSKGKGSYSVFKKPFYMIASVLKLFRTALRFKPDIFLSFASPYAGLAAWLTKKPHLVFDDTEPDPIVQAIYKRFSSLIITPACFTKDFGKKQIKVNSFKELSYLCPSLFAKNSRFKAQLGFTEEDEYILIRLVNHGAMHDMFSKKWKKANKFDFIISLALRYNIVISSEVELPDELKKYQYNLPVTDFHQAIANAKIIVGESATVAAEGAVLGVPSVYIDYNTRGYIEELSTNYGLVTHIEPTIRELKSAEEHISLIMQNAFNPKYEKNRQKLLSEKTDIAAFMVWLIENYPESAQIMKENPDYLDNFK